MENRDKHRFRFRKAGELRWVSHLDLARCFERLLRRSRLPFRSSGGFHPMPRVVFAMALPLGAVSSREVVEIEFTETLEPGETLDRLNEQTPPGLAFLDARRVTPKTTAQPRRALFRFHLPDDAPRGLDAAVGELLDSPEVWVERVRPKRRRLNIRPYLRSIDISERHLDLDIWVTPAGSARADELLRLLGLGDALADGRLLERIELELRDEVDPELTGDEPDLGKPQAVPIAPAPTEGGKSTKRAEWGASPSGPVVE